MPSTKERASEIKNMFDCLIGLENASDEVEDILKPFDQFPKLENIQQAEKELQKINVSLFERFPNQCCPSRVQLSKNSMKFGSRDFFSTFHYISKNF